MQSIYEQIADMQRQIRFNEEEVQYAMIKWNNLIIQHEKMNKLRMEISYNIDVDQEKLKAIQDGIIELKQIINQLTRICNIVDQCHGENNYAHFNTSKIHSDT